MNERKPHVLVIEDEPSFAEALAVGLGREGFRVTVAGDGVRGLDQFRRSPPDLVLLDVMLPRLSGLDVCREMRARSTVPIIMVTAKASEIDAVVGLEVGADDYVTKPYRLRELIARMRAILRRTEPRAGPAAALDAGIITVGDVTVDTERHEVTVRRALVHMPLKEFEVLTLLVENAGRVLPREVIIDRVWGSNYHGDTKTLDVHIKRLRSKLEEDRRNPRRILTIRGLGYKYEVATPCDGAWCGN
jgi:two-component system response regulator RegX3